MSTPPLVSFSRSDKGTVVADVRPGAELLGDFFNSEAAHSLGILEYVLGEVDSGGSFATNAFHGDVQGERVALEHSYIGTTLEIDRSEFRRALEECRELASQGQ